MVEVTAEQVFNPEDLPMADLIAQLEASKDKYSQGGEVEVEFGDNSSFMLDITTIVNNFMGSVFDMVSNDNNVKKYAEEHNISEEEAKEQMMMNHMIKLKAIPDASGNRPGSDQDREDGGLANIIKAFVKIISKVLGFACEIFIKLLKPIQVLIQQFISNPANPGKLGDMLFTELMMAATAATPAQAPWVVRKVLEIKKMIDNVIIVINDILAKIMALITDIQGFIVEQALKLQEFIGDTIEKGDELIKEKEQELKDIKDKKEDKIRKRVKKSKKKARDKKEARQKKRKARKGKKETPIENISIGIPAFPLGFAGVKLPKIDPTDMFGDETSPINLGNLAIYGIASINLFNLIFNPKDELSSMGFDTTGLPDDMGNIDMPEMNLDEVTFYKRIYEDPILQFKYIKELKNHNHIDNFYQQPFNTTTNEYDNLFDFFKEFDIYENKETKQTGMYDSIKEAGLDDDENFIMSFYKFIEGYGYDISSIPDNLKEFYNENGYHFKNINGLEIKITDSGFKYRKLEKTRGTRTGEDGVTSYYYYNRWVWRKIKDIDEVYGDIIKEAKLDKETFISILQLTFDMNFWNNHLINDKPYVYKVGEDGYNYKEFKFNFWKLIPERKLKYFMSFNKTYILYYEEYNEFQDNLSTDFTTILRYSNDITENGIFYKGALNDPNFRTAIGLPIKKFERLFADKHYDPNTGLPMLLGAGMGLLLELMKDQLPGVLTWIFTQIDFMIQFIMVPINYLLGFIEKIIAIVIDCITINIPGAFSKLNEFIGDLMPDFSFFTKLGESILKPVMEIFEKVMGKAFAVIDGAEQIFELYIEPVIKVFNVILSDAIPNLLMDTLMELFKVVLTSITNMIPIITIDF